MNVYQVPVPRKKNKKPSAPVPEPQPKQPTQMGQIQGKEPDSLNEWYVAVALMRYKVDFLYQVPINGGRLTRGGIVLDFLCYIPMPTPVAVMGEYWHGQTLKSEDKLKLAIIQQTYGTEPIILWGNDTDDQDKAFVTVKAELHL